MDNIDFYNSKIAEYISVRNNPCRMCNVVKYVLEQKSIDNVIELSVLSREKNGKKHSHQH